MAATLPADLVKALVPEAALFAAGGWAGSLSPNVVALTKGVLKMLWLGRLRFVAAVCLLFAAVGSETGLLAFRAVAQNQGVVQTAAADPDAQAAGATQPPSRESLRYGGKNFDDWRTILQIDLKPEVRAEAIKALSAFGTNGYSREAVAAIIETMRGYNPDDVDADEVKVVEAGRLGISKIGAPAVPLLREDLKRGPRNGRLFALAGLASIGVAAKAALPQVIEALKENDQSVRQAALWAAQAIDRDGVSVGALADLLASEDANLRSQVVDVLFAFKEKAQAAAPRLQAVVLKDPDPNIRRRALAALAQVKADTKTMLPVFEKLLTDEASDLRREAAKALA
jgi:HEAT repeat protein